MRRFSLRTVLLVVTVFAVAFLGFRQYLVYRTDYVWPDDVTLNNRMRALTSQELTRLFAVGAGGHTARLRAAHPPRGIEYWRQQARAIQPGMTVFALRRHVPSVSLSTSSAVKELDIDPGRLLCYAVDSQLAIVVCLSYEDVKTAGGRSHTLGRVKEVIGFFEHSGELTKYKTLRSEFSQHLSLADRIPAP